MEQRTSTANETILSPIDITKMLADQKSVVNKMIPMEIATHKNHTCGGRQQQEDMDFSI